MVVRWSEKFYRVGIAYVVVAWLILF